MNKGRLVNQGTERLRVRAGGRDGVGLKQSKLGLLEVMLELVGESLVFQVATTRFSRLSIRIIARRVTSFRTEAPPGFLIGEPKFVLRFWTLVVHTMHLLCRTILASPPAALSAVSSVDRERDGSSISSLPSPRLEGRRTSLGCGKHRLTGLTSQPSETTGSLDPNDSETLSPRPLRTSPSLILS
jgi:hypothetical protein